MTFLSLQSGTTFDFYAIPELRDITFYCHLGGGLQRPFADQMLWNADVSFGPNSGHSQGRMLLPLSADTVAKVENRSTLKISQKPMFRRLYRCNACQARYERPWSFLCKTMWSLTSPPAECISGPEKFRFVVPKRLLQQYLTTTDMSVSLQKICCRAAELRKR